MGHFPVFIGILDFAAFDFEHFLMNGGKAFRHFFDIRIIEIHSREIDLESACSIHKSIFVALFNPLVHIDYSFKLSFVLITVIYTINADNASPDQFFSLKTHPSEPR